MEQYIIRGIFLLECCSLISLLVEYHFKLFNDLSIFGVKVVAVLNWQVL